MLPDVLTEIPGPESRRLARELRRHESHNVTFVDDHWPVFWERAAGVNVWDLDGNRYLDLTSAFAVAGLGHGRPELVEAMRAQAATLLHGMGDVHPTRLKVELCARLSEITFERWGAGTGKTVLSNSGFEAVETALKTAVLATGRAGLVAFQGGYHGLGYGALLPTGFPKFRVPFRSQLVAELTTWLPFPRAGDDLDATRARLGAIDSSRVGALIVEPLQGRGGVIVPPDGFLGMLREWCDANRVLLVFDEIFTGFHRSGSLFACEREQVAPDLICLGKAMSGGFPISACVGRAEVMDAWPKSSGEALHTSTFLGHPVGCAMALEALRLHERPETREAVARLETTMRNLTKPLGPPVVAEVRGRGAMWGIEVESGPRAAATATKLLKAGILILPGGPQGNVLTITPPFAIAEEELGHAIHAVERSLEESR